MNRRAFLAGIGAAYAGTRLPRAAQAPAEAVVETTAGRALGAERRLGATL